MHFLCLLDGYPGLVWRNARTCFTTNDELYERRLLVMDMFSDSKVHGDNKGPTWVLSAPDRPHIGPMNLAIRVITSKWNWDVMIHDCFKIIIHCSAVVTFRQSHYLLHLHYLCNIMQPALTLMYSLCFGNDNFTHIHQGHLLFHAEWFQLCAPSQCWEIIAKQIYIDIYEII